MSDGECNWASSWKTLVLYYSADLSADDEARLEAHFFSCARCASASHEAARLVAKVARAAASGGMLAVVDRSLVERYAHAGMIVQEETADEHRRVHVPVRPGVDLMVGHLPGDFSGVESVDVEFDNGALGITKENGVPVKDPAEILVACTLHYFYTGRALPPTTCRIFAGGEERLLGEYALSFGRAD